MKTVFIINPCAGKGKAENLIDRINSLSDADIDIYITQSVGDATRYVAEYCRDNGAARFIACGGDGTLSEILNGIMNFPDAEVGVIPVGSGNDFCRNFGNDCSFDDVYAQVYGDTVKCDAIKYTAETESGTVTGYCANMFNIGFDCNVADLASRIKTRPFVSGSMAYLVSVFYNLIKKRGANLKIIIDAEEKHCGRLLLTSIANGCFCGGGIKSNPEASVMDGRINVNIIRDVSRLKFIFLFPSYANGTYMKRKNIDKVIMSANCRELEVIPLDGNMRICIDGEIIDTHKTHFEICHRAFNFVKPTIIEKR